MLRILLPACFVLLVACQDPERDRAVTVAELQQAALADETAWQLLSSLTSEVGPRMAGSEGDRKAVAWAQAQMDALGFDRVWTEPVEFPFWVRRGESAYIAGAEPVALDLIALGGVGGTGGDLEAPLVAFDTLAELEAVTDGSLQGRIAYISARMRRTQDGAGYGETVPQRSRGPFVAQRKGAAALLIRSVGTDYRDSAPHTGNVSGTEPGEPVPAAALSHASADRLEALLEAGQEVRVVLNLDCGFEGVGRSFNVIGEYTGATRPDEFVLIGGHLDSWDPGTGAHDDGAGVVITMAAARLVAALPQRPARSIRVVLFANEEQGIYGATQYAAAHANELGRHVLGSESDLGAGRIYQFRARVSEAGRGRLAELEALLAPLGIPYNRDALAGGGADIGQMRMLGMPVIDLRHDASRYFDLHHTRNDVIENVDPRDLQFNVAAYVSLLMWAADSDTAFGPVPTSE